MNRMLEGCVSSVVMLRLGKSLREDDRGSCHPLRAEGLSGSLGCGVDLMAVGSMVDPVVITGWPLVGLASSRSCGQG